MMGPTLGCETVTDVNFIDTAPRICATAESLRDFDSHTVAQFRANSGRILIGPGRGLRCCC
jgi:hypothetical protein